jgi:phosphatidylglycerol:prolipoprotein diacylglycerol transferase
MFPKLISIGDFFLPTYGLLVALGFLSALWLTARLARRSGLDPDKVTNLGVYAALAGLGGAKLLMFALDFSYYAAHPRQIFSLATLQAGGVFYGGLITALIAGFFYMRAQRLPPARTLDCFAPGLALGQGIGRIGCFAAGCCWGESCSRPWAVTFTDPEAHRLVGVPLDTALHPTQMYEAAGALLIFAVLLRRFSLTRAPGHLIGIYLILTATARFTVEFFRAHEQPNPFAGPLSTAQWISIALLLLGGGFIFKLRPSQPRD